MFDPFAGPAQFLAGEVSATLGLLNETASDNVADRIVAMEEAVLLNDATVEEVAQLRDRGYSVEMDGTFALVRHNAEVAAKKKKATTGKGKAKTPTSVGRKGGLQIKHMRDRGAMNIVRKLYSTYIGAEDDYTHFANFFSDFDSLIGEYRKHCGLDCKEGAEELEEDDGKYDDFNKDDLVASLNEDVESLPPSVMLKDRGDGTYAEVLQDGAETGRLFVIKVDVNGNPCASLAPVAVGSLGGQHPNILPSNATMAVALALGGGDAGDSTAEEEK